MPTDRETSIFSEPFGVLWRSAIVKLPRHVPPQILRWTSPEGPQPFLLNLPSRANYLIPSYVFIPTDLAPEEAAGLPVIVDFHGGGFFLGSCLEQAPFCAKLARELHAVVLTVDYRLGPVDKHPAAIEDGEDVMRAVLDEHWKGYNVLREAVAKQVNQNFKETGRSLKTPDKVELDNSRVAVSGFSSGGNLALNMALSVNKGPTGPEWPSVVPRDYPHKLVLLLYYPSFDARQLPSERTCPPGLPVSKGFWSDVSDILAPSYLPRERAGEPRASPGLVELAGLHRQARMLLVLPGLDSLAEQSEAWVQKVQDGGRGDDLRVKRFPTMRHGWTQMPESWLDDEAKHTRRDIFDQTVAFTRSIWDEKSVVVNGIPRATPER